VLVARHEADRGDEVAVGERDAGVGRRGDAARDAGADLERHAGRLERLGLLAAADEDERVPALPPADALARLAQRDQAPSEAGAAMPLVTPGTTSNGTPAASSASASSPPRPKTNGSPPFSRQTLLPAWPRATRIRLISSCDMLGPPPCLPT